MGPNGSGKTTLFHIIMGLLTPSSGTIEFFGKPVKTEKDFRKVYKKVGLLFQDADDQLFSPTVLEDVAFGPLNLGKSKLEARNIAQNTLERLGIAHFENRVTHKLSGGEKRLVALATVLSMEPELLLLDEPNTGVITSYSIHYTKLYETCRSGNTRTRRVEISGRQPGRPMSGPSPRYPR